MTRAADRTVRRQSLLLVLAFGLVGPWMARADELPDCDKRDLLRLEIMRFPSELLDAQKQHHDVFMRETRSALLKIRDIDGLGGDEFRYLDGIEVIEDPGELPTGNRGYEAYFEEEDRRGALQTVNVYVASESQTTRYFNDIYIGPGCSLSRCYFDDSKEVPPRAHDRLVKEYHLVLTLYALASNAALSRCDEKIVKTLYQVARERITHLARSNMRFDRMEELEAHITLRSAAYTREQAP